MRYIALIGDIIGSRSLRDRAESQTRLGDICEKLNTARPGGLTSPLTLTLGDEFQALFSGAQNIWRCIYALESGMHPVKIRFALGIGELTTEVNETSALGMDGPAFHHARNAIATMKKAGTHYRIAGLPRSEALVRHSLDLLSYNRAKWKRNRLAVLAHLLDGKSIDEIVTLLGITEQAVYRNIRDGALESVMGILAETARLMDEALERTDDA